MHLLLLTSNTIEVFYVFFKLSFANKYLKSVGDSLRSLNIIYIILNKVAVPRTTVSQDVQTRFPVQLAFAKFLAI